MPIIIGIAGGSASGKTSIAKHLKNDFGASKSVVIIRQDDYYKDQSDLAMEVRVLTNYDHPLAFDNDLLIHHLEQLNQNKSIEKPIYDFTNHTRSCETEIIEPCDVIVIEGLFVLENQQLRSKLDIKIFVDTDADIRFIRRLIRDVNDRGRAMDNIIAQYTNTVRVMHDLFIEPSRRYADVIIPEGGKNNVAIDLLATKINSIISKNMV